MTVLTQQCGSCCHYDAKRNFCRRYPPVPIDNRHARFPFAHWDDVWDLTQGDLTLSYTIDAYRSHARPWKSFLDFALFVTFFPQLVAGPIVRAADFLPQCLEPRRADRRQLGWGLTLLIVGLFNKMVVSDALLAPVAFRSFAEFPLSLLGSYLLIPELFDGEARDAS